MYKNTRLKHVKKIREVIADMPIYWQGYTDLILDQCNLLLETKKKKKCLHKYYKYSREELKQKLAIFFLECNLSKSQDSEAVEFLDLIVATKGINKNNTPSRQPEIEELYMEGDFGDIAPSNEEITFKLNQVIYQLNKITKTK